MRFRDLDKLKRLKELSVKVNLTVPEQTEARSLLEDLASRYGDLGLVVDTANGKIVSLNTAAGKLQDVKFKVDDKTDLTKFEKLQKLAAEVGKGIYADMVEGDIGVLFTMSSGTKMFVKLTDLVDTYEADNTSAKGVAVTVDGYKISAETNISEETGNLVQLKDDGVYVPPMEWQTLPE